MVYFSLTDFLRVSAYRIAEAVHYFSTEATGCADKKKRKYLRFLIKKKQMQKVVLNQIAKNLLLPVEMFHYTDFSCQNYIMKSPTALGRLSMKELDTFTYQHAIEELEFFISLLPHIDDTIQRHVINTFIDLARSFIYTTRIGYLNTLTKETTHNVSAYEIFVAAQQVNERMVSQ